VPEIKQQGSFGPADFHIDTRIIEYIVDQITGEGGVHVLVAS
jgi:hypothetical protein